MSARSNAARSWIGTPCETITCSNGELEQLAQSRQAPPLAPSRPPHAERPIGLRRGQGFRKDQRWRHSRVPEQTTP